MQKHSLGVVKRKVFGKKVKQLRKSGILPANIYGKGFNSIAIETPAKDFLNVLHEAGHSGVVELKLDGETIPTLIHEVTYDHIDRVPLHADFYKVNLKEKVKANVPVVLVGEPQAVTDKLGLLIQPLNEVEVEALPTELPENIEVDVTKLAQVGDGLTVGDLKASTGVEILTDPGQTVAKITELVSKETEEQLAAEEAASEATEGESGAEGEAPAEGGAPAEDEAVPEE